MLDIWLTIYILFYAVGNVLTIGNDLRNNSCPQMVRFLCTLSLIISVFLITGIWGLFG